MNNAKPIIYQLLPRLFSNSCDHCVPGGTISQNQSGKMNHINSHVLKSIHDMGVTHIWYTGVIEHANKTDYTKYGLPKFNPHVIKGNAGSPYAITDYYDIDPDIAEDVPNRMSEFHQLVERTHVAGMKVIIDFVPNHVARVYRSDAKPENVKDFGITDNTGMFFDPNNNFYYITGETFEPQDVDLGSGKGRYVEFPAKATGNDCFTAHPSVNDWYETVKLNYGVDPWNGSKHFDPIPDTWHKMLHILKFWAAKGIDGFRCDMVHMVPVAFWHWAIAQVKADYPDLIFIAEIYDVNLYDSYVNYGGFNFLYDKVTLYDTLCAVMLHQAPASNITYAWQQVDWLKNHMLNFLENHDEVRLASRQFLGDPFRAIPAAVVSATLSSCPFMVYAGQELGEKAEDAEGFNGDNGKTTIFDYWSIPSLRKWYNGGKCNLQKLNKKQRELRRFYSTLLNICNKHKAIYQGESFDLTYANHGNYDTNAIYAYLRKCDDELMLIVANFGDDTSNHAATTCVPVLKH